MDEQPSEVSSSNNQPKKTVHTGVPTINIKEQFLVAASHLRSGQLVKDEALTLFEAVGALEIGDAKMDSGFLEPGELLEDDYDVTSEISPEQTVWLMDELFYREAAWHGGYPLSQTLFTSLYIDALLWPDPTSLANAAFSRTASADEQPPLLNLVFRAYCLAVVKCCDLFLSVVTSQHYYEEEDLATQTFNRDLLHKFEAHDIVLLVEEAERWLTASDLEVKLRLALRERLMFRKAFLQVLDTTQQDLQTHAQTSLEMIKLIENNDYQGQPLPAAFSTKVQRRLASTVPPRPMIAVERSKACSHFEKLCADIFDAQAVLAADCGEDMLTAIWCLMSQPSQPSVYVRSFLQTMLNRDGQVLGRSTLDDFFLQDIKLLIQPHKQLLGQNEAGSLVVQDEITNLMNTFLSKCGPSYLNVFKCFCLNRCRVRRTLCHAIVEWDQMQVDTEDTDAALSTLIGEESYIFPIGGSESYSYPLSSWIYHHKLGMMELVIRMGFELSIYQPYELRGLFWYLSYICGVHLAHLERISFFASKSKVETTSEADSNQQLDPEPALDLYRQFRKVKAVDALAQALHTLYSVLDRHGIFPPPQSAYRSDRLQYELRMRPFLHVAVPEAIGFDDFSKIIKLEDLSDDELLERAAEYCSQSKRTWEDMLKNQWHCAPLHLEGNERRPSQPEDSSVKREWTKQIQNSMKSAIATSISISTLRNVLKKSGGNSRQQIKAKVPGPGETGRWHAFWPVPVIER